MKERIIDCELLKEFTRRCLTSCYDEWAKNKFKSYWENAIDIDEFKRSVLSDKSLAMTQGYAELSKETPGHTKRFLSQFNSILITESEVGSLKVGNDNFSFNLPNGIGDGKTKVVITREKEINTNMVNFFTKIEGTFNIYDYDCGNDILTSLNGKYHIFYLNGIVVFGEL